eukprot:scaffold18207_cov88-Skeletonema_marinoi.AAC.2
MKLRDWSGLVSSCRLTLSCTHLTLEGLIALERLALARVASNIRGFEYCLRRWLKIGIAFAKTTDHTLLVAF